MNNPLENQWALILGASSGFGAATSLELARAGMNIFGVHLDRKSTMHNVEEMRRQIEETGRESMFFNINAANHDKREGVLDTIEETLREKGSQTSIRIFLHSLAFGSLGRYFPPDSGKPITHDQMKMTLDVMAHSLVYWVQSLVRRELMGEQSRIFAMTSSGGHRVWASYGPVSAAKAALESHIRQIALELAPLGITANAIQAGVTDTPALRGIPGHEEMIKTAKSCNPAGRLTTPQDVGKAIVAFSHPYTQWMTGNVIRV
ncbi:SDR family oxidoreductase, partial [Acidobacteria bacterium AH-259-D05]|nr:SDR family oxidoreductase [Acidobacteria bacterium AH-259-D05]